MCVAMLNCLDPSARWRKGLVLPLEQREGNIATNELVCYYYKFNL